MNYINRPNYINAIKPYIGVPIIKVITGMRRVGKSTLLKIIRDEVLCDIPNERKIYINFELSNHSNINTSSDLSNYINVEVSKTTEKIYFFFDEIQLLEGWEKAINALNAIEIHDVFITGSNSNMLSGNLATLISGRYKRFKISPFSFSEFCEVHKESNLSNNELFNKYLVIGGMPSLKYMNLDEQLSKETLNDIYDTIVYKDVIRYYNVRNIDMFNHILAYALENIGHTFSANSLHRYFKNKHRKISVDSILNYLSYSCESFILNKVPSFDVEGKKIVKVDEKYYLTDHGFRELIGISNKKDIERVLENIVYVELLTRGYTITIGKVNNKEIDFIATKNGTIEYYQVSYIMETEKTREREFGVYKEIKDNYPKYVLSMDKIDFSNNGIIHKNIIDFLLGEK